MEFILNYIKVNDNISTAGQPSAKQFSSIADNDFDVVINLALSNSDDALEGEDQIVTELGMSYFHIPVDFKNPKSDDLKLFLNLLLALDNKKVFVHCIMNYRVTAFMYVYHKYILKTPFDDIDLSLLEEWGPEDQWQELIKSDVSILD